MTKVTASRIGSLERRLLWLSLGLSVSGSLVTWLCFGGREGLSFLAGGAVAAVDLGWLRSTINSMFARDPNRSKSKVLAGFFLRLLLIPLCLYVMIRFLFLSILAAVAGFAVFNCSIFVEGVLEAFKSRSK